MNLKTLTRKDVLNLADSSTIFHRGEDYYKSGVVRKFSATPELVKAKIEGNYGNYKITVEDTGDELETQCSCPYDGDVCKHIIAVLLHYLDNKPEGIAAGQSSNPDALERALAAMSHKELLELVSRLSREKSKFRRLLLANVQIAPHIIRSTPGNPAKVKKLKKEIDNFFSETRYNYYNDYGYDSEGDEEYEELQKVFETTQTLNPSDQAEIFWYVLESGNETFLDEPGVGTPQLEEAARLFGDAVSKLSLSHKEKQAHFGSLLEALEWEMCGYGDLTEALKQALDTICSQREDYLYLIDQFDKGEFPEADEWIAGYYLKLGDEENYLQIRRQNLDNERQYLELADFWRAKGDQKTYVSTLEEWVAKLTKEKKGSSYYSFSKNEDGVLNRLAALYAKDDAELCRILVTKAKYERMSLDLYKRIEKVARRLNRWNKLKPSIIEAAKNDSRTLAEIYLYEEDWDAAIELEKKENTWSETRDLIAEGIKKHRPEAAIAIYKKQVQSCINGQNRASYKIAATYAEKVKTIYTAILKDKSAWENYIMDIRKQYPRHHALQDEFRKL